MRKFFLEWEIFTILHQNVEKIHTYLEGWVESYDDGNIMDIGIDGEEILLLRYLIYLIRNLNIFKKELRINLTFLVLNLKLW